MIDWLRENSNWITALSGITTIVCTIYMLIRWLLLRTRQQKHDSDVTLKPSNMLITAPSLGRIFPVNVPLLKIAAYVCGATFIIFFLVMMFQDAQQTNSKIRLYTKQVKEAFSALESVDLEEFQKKATQIHPEIETIFEQRIGMATGSSLRKLKKVIEDYQYIKKVHYKSLKSNIFIVSSPKKASLYSVNKEKNKIIRVFSFKYSSHGFVTSPHSKKLGFYVQRGVFSKTTKFYVININGHYLKQIYTSDSNEEIVRWESDSVLIITDNEVEKKIVLTDENNPQ